MTQNTLFVAQNKLFANRWLKTLFYGIYGNSWKNHNNALGVHDPGSASSRLENIKQNVEPWYTSSLSSLSQSPWWWWSSSSTLSSSHLHNKQGRPFLVVSQASCHVYKVYTIVPSACRPSVHTISASCCTGSFSPVWSYICVWMNVWTWQRWQ